MKAKAKHEGPLKIDVQFDDAIKRALAVKPPKEGWEEYEKSLKKQQKRPPKKTANTQA